MSLFQDELANRPGTWRSHVWSILTDRIFDAFWGTKATHLSLAHQVQKCFDTAFRAAPEHIRRGLISDEYSDIRIAFQLGQLSMAQQLLGQTGPARADDDFPALLVDEEHGPVVKLLSHAELTCKELAQQLATQEAVMRSRLQHLILKGAVDFRHYGPEACYFLTPAATSLLPSP